MNVLPKSIYLALALMTGWLLSSCQSNPVALGMSKESLEATYGPPKRKEVLADGREEWFYDTRTEKKTRETFSNPNTYHYPGTSEASGFQWEGSETSSGVTFTTKFITNERPVSISPNGKVEGIPNGTIVENR